MFSRTGPWTDVHALGLLFTELMTGEPPFADTRAPLHEQVMSADRPTPGRKGIDVGPFEAVIARALALRTADRWRDAAALLTALEEAGSGVRSSLQGDAAPAEPPGDGSQSLRAVVEPRSLAGEATVPMSGAIGALTGAIGAMNGAIGAPVYPAPLQSVAAEIARPTSRVRHWTATRVLALVMLAISFPCVSFGVVHVWRGRHSPSAPAPRRDAPAGTVAASAVVQEHEASQGLGFSIQAPASGLRGPVANPGPIPVPVIHRAPPAAIRNRNVVPSPQPNRRGLDVFDDTK